MTVNNIMTQFFVNFCYRDHPLHVKQHNPRFRLHRNWLRRFSCSCLLSAWCLSMFICRYWCRGWWGDKLHWFLKGVSYKFSAFTCMVKQHRFWFCKMVCRSRHLSVTYKTTTSNVSFLRFGCDEDIQRWRFKNWPKGL